MKITAHCPECDSSDIREENVAYADLPVTEWELDKDGQLQPSEFDTDVGSPEWSSAGDQPYVCRDCGNWRGDLHQLVVKQSAEDAE